MRNNHLFYIILFVCNLLFLKGYTQNDDYHTRFEQSNYKKTANYQEIISFYQRLSNEFDTVSLLKMEMTDSGFPLHLVFYNPTGKITWESVSEIAKNKLLINNGIHPGESDGIDASMMLIRDLALGKIKTPKNTVIAVIPIYNVGGALNQNSTTRTNQNGPLAYGFRGNARNFDLNRDFIKCDTKNAKSFANLLHQVNPQVFIDTHVSNGADYQYTLTHLFTQHNKLNGDLGDYLHKVLQPKLEASLLKKEWTITPYVNVFNQSPEKGFAQFLDTPRYSTGYTTLFGIPGMMVETHMLKPYKDRVYATYDLLKSMIEIVDADSKQIRLLSSQAYTRYQVGADYPIQWEVDKTQKTTLHFKGFEASFLTSKITGYNRLFYDRNKPYTRDVSYYNYYKPKVSVVIPKAYIIPKGWWNVIALLTLNNIQLTKIKKDTLINAQVYRIKDYKTVENPFEGHYLHYNTHVQTLNEKVKVFEGDYLVYTQQKGVRYILETLEPSAPDSFFNWNFFDTILQQKEGFSPYVWEDKAWEFLTTHPNIKKQFEEKKRSDSTFSKNWYAQLDWIHKQSPHYEKSHLRYPIIRVGG